MRKAKYPAARLRLVGRAENAHLLLKSAQSALRAAGVPEPEIGVFTHNALAKDHDHMVRVILQWVSVD